MLSFFVLWKETDGKEELTKMIQKDDMSPTWKGSQQSLLMQGLLPHQALSHAGFRTCIISPYMGIYEALYILPEQAQTSSIGAHIATNMAASLETSFHHLPQIFCQHLGPQVKRDHHPLICQGGVQCFKNHPSLNMIFLCLPFRNIHICPL